jgi:hypothetical protein
MVRHRLQRVANMPGIVKLILVWVLILHTFHAPLPCPELDGECRGTPIESLAEPHAWHVLLLGVRSPRDIDCGPFAPVRDPSDKRPVFSLYGEEAVPPRIAVVDVQEPVCA